MHLLVTFSVVITLIAVTAGFEPTATQEVEIVHLHSVSYHRKHGPDQAHLIFSFRAFEKDYIIRLRKSDPFIYDYGDYGLPFVTMDSESYVQETIDFRKMGIQFYHDGDINGVFSVRYHGVNGSSYPLYELNGIINGVHEDIIVQSRHPSTRLRSDDQGNFINHFVYRKRRASLSTECHDVTSVKCQRSVAGFTTDVFNGATKTGLGKIDIGNANRQSKIFSNSDREADVLTSGSGAEIINNLLPQMKSILQVSKSPGRVNGTVEILVYTDLSFYNSFTALVGPGNEEQEILKYVAIVIHAGNLRYKYGVRDNSLNISLVLTGVVICKDISCSGYTENYKINNSVNNYKALDGFAALLHNHTNMHRFNFKHDYAVAFTRLDLTDPNGTPVGVSFTNKICSTTDGKSSSIVEDQGGYSSIGTFVHELAHTLGSDHDGWFRSRSCFAMDGYIMSTLSPLTKNGFFFSQCSINSIKANLLLPSANCIHDIPIVNSTLQVLGDQMPGQIYNRTSQCQQIYGTDFCLSVGTTMEDICYKMFCWDPVLPNVCSTKSPAALGTSCGYKKWCVRGECVYDVNAPG